MTITWLDHRVNPRSPRPRAGRSHRQPATSGRHPGGRTCAGMLLLLPLWPALVAVRYLRSSRIRPNTFTSTGGEPPCATLPGCNPTVGPAPNQAGPTSPRWQRLNTKAGAS
jgi:hypothetical protein